MNVYEKRNCAPGVLFGDGTIAYTAKKTYEISLQAKDFEFVSRFARCLAAVLNKPLKRPKKLKKESFLWYVRYFSKSFYCWYKLLRDDVRRAQPYVERDKETVREFLRGIYDSEGCLDSQGRVRLYNANIALLRYAQDLLRSHFYIPSRIQQIRNTLYALEILLRKTAVEKFLCEIGFTIPRKSRKQRR